MRKKTEELRDIFVDVTDGDTVVERQEESPGSLTDGADGRERLEGVVSRMRDRYGFETSLSTSDLARVVERYHDGRTDEDIAGDIGANTDEVFDARMSLHLTSDDDRDSPFDFGAFRKRIVDEPSVEELCEAFDIDESTARRYRRVVEAENEGRRANQRFRDEFEGIVTDGDLSARLTRDVRNDGLSEATDGVESNVSF